MRISHAGRRCGSCGRTKASGLDEMRRAVQEHLALGERLAHQPELVVLEVTKPAVDQLGAPLRRGAGDVVLLDQEHLEAAARRIAGDACPVDAGTDYGKVVRRVASGGHGEECRGTACILPQRPASPFALPSQPGGRTLATQWRPHEHRPRNRRARAGHEVLAAPPSRPSRNGVRGNGHRCLRRRQAALVRARRAYGTRQDRRRRRAARRQRAGRRAAFDRPARRPRRAAHPRAVGRRARVEEPREDACLRPRRPHVDAAWRRGDARADERLQRHRPFHLPAGGGERGRRPGDGRGGAVRPVSHARGVRDAQLAAARPPARSRCAPDR